MQKPTAPSLEVEECPARYVAAPARSFSARSILRAMKSLPAASGSLAVWPGYRSGASAEYPATAKRSQTFLMCPTRPHHSWITRTPGPLPDAGIDRCPFEVCPLLGNSTILTAIASSFLVLGSLRVVDLLRDIRGDAHRQHAAVVGLEHGDREASDAKDLPDQRDAVHGGEHEAGHRFIVAPGQLPLQRLVDLVEAGPARDSIAAVGQALDGVRIPVVLVADLADHLLDDVLHGDDAHRAAVFVHHHRQLQPVALHLAQEAVDAA